jgi:hypothetical protein
MCHHYTDEEIISVSAEALALSCRTCIQRWMQVKVNQRLYMGRAVGHIEAGTTRQADLKIMEEYR